ncbi:hypothetical protein G7Y89_g857 [Cudoniella acicularis]|uniref:Uncharacterized protein n=1 Tax=Cudoniella acicularis TaxID=354080 RepID=A0A8H4RZ83_9HELO|nr:hypothetical protein G7Y89_g857 [Cudoniella acicularis]
MLFSTFFAVLLASATLVAAFPLKEKHPALCAATVPIDLKLPVGNATEILAILGFGEAGTLHVKLDRTPNSPVLVMGHHVDT